ncbi:MAG: hypothetical protein LBQ31_02940 [Bacteroidales bacterium]|nr:hypothetical protein [Bacteroidales bacterium]
MSIFKDKTAKRQTTVELPSEVIIGENRNLCHGVYLTIRLLGVNFSDSRCHTFLACLVIACFVSCSAPLSKESYLKKYNTFIVEISEKSKTYDDKEWQIMTEKHEKFSGEWYDKFKDDFTFKEEVAIKAYQAKFYYHRTLNQSTSIIKQLLDSLNIKEMKKQLQYYVDNDMQTDLQKFYNEAKKAGKEAEEAVLEILEELKINIEELKK